MSTSTPVLSVVQMTRRLTTPYARGADMLPLTLESHDDAALAKVAAYDFRDHRALFDQEPAPRYVLTALRDIPVDTEVTIDYAAKPGGQGQPQVSLPVPAGTLAGASFALDLGTNEGPEARLTQVKMNPRPAKGKAADSWRLTALLGNIAKLLWVMGWERDHIRQQLVRTTAQRQLTHALGLSLDLIGFDLGIPRFPPLPYSFDKDTIALYHLNAQPSTSGPVEDIIGRYPNQPGHNGTIVGDVAGVRGRFGNGFAFRKADAAVEIAHHGDFDLDVSPRFSVECFVLPNQDAQDGHVLSKHPDPTPGTNQAGWALSVGEWGRGLPLNPRWLVSDGAIQLELFADVSLPSERFSHLAAVIDRPAGFARLYVDGRQVAQEKLGDLKAITNTEPVRIGHLSAALQGVVDEVRLSRAARSAFHPVLGESDSSYRQRLRFFRRWVLPTPANLLAMLNEAIDSVNDDKAPLIVNEVNTTIVGGAQTIAIAPVSLLPGECIDAAGRRRVTEAEVCGTAAAETLFDPVYLVEHHKEDQGVVYASPELRVGRPNAPAPDSHKMQLVVERALNRLLHLVGEPNPGTLTVQSAFDPAAPDLRATGRGVLFHHTTIPVEGLAALAHRAGFTFVCHRADLGMVYASCALDEYIEIVTKKVSPVPSPGVDARVEDSLTLEVRPAANDATYRWLTIACGKGRAEFSSPPTGVNTILKIKAPGELTVRVDALRRRGVISATRMLRLGIQPLANDSSIGSDGDTAAKETVAGVRDAFFHPAFLVNHDDPRAEYGADPNHHMMQAAVAARLTRLLDLLGNENGGGRLQVFSAFEPGASDLAGVGRGLTLRHSTLPAGRLAALAHAAGFTFVRRQGANVLIRQAAADLVSLSGDQQVDEGKQVTLAVPVNPGDVGDGVRLQWTLSAAGQAEARLSSTTLPTVQLQGARAGQVRVQALYLIGDNPAPYTFEVRLNPDLEADSAVVIRKEQYDLVMNILNAFHPVGVEVITQALRDRVVELQGSALEANPDYTYPNFRVRGPAPRGTRKE